MAKANTVASKEVINPEHWPTPTLEVQVERSKKHYPGIDLSYVEEIGNAAVRPKADSKWSASQGLIIIVKLAHLGHRFGIDDPYGKGYGLILAKQLELLKAENGLVNTFRGESTSEPNSIPIVSNAEEVDASKTNWPINLEIPETRVRLHKDLRDFTKEVEDRTPGDVLVLNFRSAFTYRYSLEGLRQYAKRDGELVFGGAQTAGFLLVAPERLQARLGWADIHNHWLHCYADEVWYPKGGWCKDCFTDFGYRDGGKELSFSHSCGAYPGAWGPFYGVIKSRD